MARIVNTIPQQLESSRHTFLTDLIAGLPDLIPFNDNIGITGRLKYGRQAGNLCFIIQSDEAPSVELRQAFSNYVQDATGGLVAATVSNAWRRKEFDPRWIYSEGKKILRVENGKLVTDLVQPVDLPIWLPAQKVVDRLIPAQWSFPVDCYLTGGLVRENGSFNDVDFIVGFVDENAEIIAVAPPELCKAIKTYFQNLICADVGINEPYATNVFHIDVGSKIMSDREPVSLCKVFEVGTLNYIGPIICQQ